ncbi:MAG TPA: hypothetical protein VD766_07615, partial [Solirubrobacterales bacterium]|nr:hypothetical protein [Solirubrobacterales bacterium]
MEGKFGRSISTLVGAAIAFLGIPAHAGANDHLVNVGEVFPGTVGQPNAEFVELQMRAAGQSVVAGNKVHVYNASGALIATHTLPANVASGANQASILFATNDAAAFFGVAADLAIPAGLPPGGGQVCYEDIDGASAGFIDCASWGTFNAPPPSASPG